MHGIHADAEGRIVTPNRIIAKVSRVEVASKFFAPPPERYLARAGAPRSAHAGAGTLAARIPVAQDLTAEADSGGHTDNRPAITLLPTMLALRDRLQAQYRLRRPLRVGAAGGIATPASVAAAFVMGAAYVLTGSINQACVESGSSDAVREMLAQAEQADVDHGAGRRHVRDGRQGAGAEARHHVRHARRQAVRTLSRLPAWKTCPPPNAPLWKKTFFGRRSKKSGHKLASSS